MSCTLDNESCCTLALAKGYCHQAAALRTASLSSSGMRIGVTAGDGNRYDNICDTRLS
ncbi:MAG: hypothetical protein MZV63_52885 [Marinilabiliales bacterium]|nr:hypothetical protein [Marinilabiliales bacterium]